MNEQLRHITFPFDGTYKVTRRNVKKRNKVHFGSRHIPNTIYVESTDKGKEIRRSRKKPQYNLAYAIQLWSVTRFKIDLMSSSSIWSKRYFSTCDIIPYALHTFTKIYVWKKSIMLNSRQHDTKIKNTLFQLSVCKKRNGNDDAKSKSVMCAFVFQLNILFIKRHIHFKLYQSTHIIIM